MAEENEQIQPFAAILRQLRKGGVHDELTEKMHEVIAAVRETGKPGSLTLTLKVEQEKNTDMLKTTDKVDAKIPELDRGANLWFVDGKGNLCRDNPEQMRFRDMEVVPSIREAK